MRAIRRTYLYAMSLVSFFVTVWGIIFLLRTLLRPDTLLGAGGLVAQGLSLILVGLPVFALHFTLAQRETFRDPEELTARLRALFLYALLFGTLVPAVQNWLSLVARAFMLLFQIDPSLALTGGNQTWADNLVGAIINLLAAAFVYRYLAADWQRAPEVEALADTRRLYRLLWMVYGLGLLVLGVQLLLRFSLFTPEGLGGSPASLLANGLALLVVGLPLWLWSLVRSEDMLDDPTERESLLRRVALYLLALTGIGAVLAASGVALATLLRWLLGEAMTPAEFLRTISGPISTAIPLAGVWAFYGRRLDREVAAVPDPPRRSGLRRLYFYIQAFFGLGALLYGLEALLGILVELSLGSGVFEAALRSQLAGALAALILGLPLWLLNWLPMQSEAGAAGSQGDHARRSLVRKGYLYLALFSTVVITMVFTAAGVYNLLDGLLGGSAIDLARDTLDPLLSAALFGLFALYHSRALRADGILAGKALAERHALFPTLILDPGDGSFSAGIMAALQRQAPGIPVAVQLIPQGVPGEEMTGARAVVLPSSLAAQPPEALRLWLHNFSGRRLVVPVADDAWVWLGPAPRSGRALDEDVATALRQLAEDQPVRPSAPSNPWVIVGYIFGTLFALQLLFVLVSVLFSGL